MMRWFIAAAFAAAVAGTAGSGTVAAQDSGLRCSFSPGSPMASGQVDCTVHDDRVTVKFVTFNRGNCPARVDDDRAFAAYLQFWNDTAENRAWWRNSNYRGTYSFGQNFRVEASASCGNATILEYSIETDRGVFRWTTRR
jgi:hypothetical protein